MELLQKIYDYATILDVLHLSMTSKKHRAAFLGRKMPILRSAFYNSHYSPYPELLKLVISGMPDPNRKLLSTEVRRRAIVSHVINASVVPTLTLDLIQRMVRYAKVANKWTEIYPQLRWRYDSDERRVLHPHEAERLRCAIYQHWTYSNLFHDKDYCEWDPDAPYGHRSDLRLRLVRTWTTIQIVRQSEFVDKMRQLLEIELYPSDAIIQHRHSRPLPPKELAKYGWGGYNPYTELCEALLKFTPEDILHVYQSTSTKSERLDFLRSKGSWFQTPASWDQAVGCMANEERSRPGRPHPRFPSASVSCLPLRVDLEDHPVEFGIIDCCKEDGPAYYKSHLYANDASPSGEWVAEHLRPSFRSRLWLEDNADGDSDSE